MPQKCILSADVLQQLIHQDQDLVVTFHKMLGFPAGGRQDAVSDCKSIAALDDLKMGTTQHILQLSGQQTPAPDRHAYKCEASTGWVSGNVFWAYVTVTSLILIPHLQNQAVFSTVHSGTEAFTSTQALLMGPCSSAQ